MGTVTVLPSAMETINRVNEELVRNKEAAIPWVENFIQRNTELEEIFNTIQPLLYELSRALYTDDQPVALNKLVEDAINYIKAKE